MKLRSLTLAAAILLGVASAAVAQDRPRGDRPDRTGRAAASRGITGPCVQMRQDVNLRRALFRGIELSDAQRQQVRAIGDRYRPQYDSLARQLRARRDAGTPPDSAFRRAMREQRLALSQRQRAEVRAVLTPEQQTRLDANAAAIVRRAEERVARLRERVELRAPR